MCSGVVRDYSNIAGAQEECFQWLKLSLNHCLDTISPKSAIQEVWGWTTGIFTKFSESKGTQMSVLKVQQKSFVVNPYKFSAIHCQQIFSMIVDDFLLMKKKEIAGAQIVGSKVEVPYTELIMLTCLAGIVAILGLLMLWKLTRHFFASKLETTVRTQCTSSQTILPEFLPADYLKNEKIEDQNERILDAIIGISDSDSARSLNSDNSICCSINSGATFDSVLPPGMKAIPEVPDYKKHIARMQMKSIKELELEKC